MPTRRSPPLCPSCGSPIDEATTTWRGWGVDLLNNCAVGPMGIEIALQPSAAVLLHILISRKGGWATRDFIVDQMWGTATDALPKDPVGVIRTYLTTLRHALGADGITFPNLPNVGWAVHIPEE